MLSIPEEVKRALRKGNLRKKYEFTVRSSYDVITYEDIYTFTSTSDVCNVPKVGEFEWYAAEGDGVIGYYNLVKTDETVVTGDVTIGASIDCGYGDTLTLTSMNVTPIILREKFTESEMRDDFVIDNETLVRESVKIDERMATGKNLKFGLCEGSALEFQYFDHPNINGKEIKADIKVEYKDSDGILQWYSIPMGFYTVDQCPMQFDTGIYKVTAYNKLRSSYLDYKANALIADAFGDLSSGQTVKFYDIRRLLLNDYEISYSEGHEALQYIDTLYYGRCSGQTIKFKAAYGINTPWSYGQFEVQGTMPVPFSESLYPQCMGRTFTATLDPDKAYTLTVADFLEDLEEKVYNTIIDIVNKSFSVTGQSFVNTMMTYGGGGTDYSGWCSFYGVILTDENDNVEKYSTIGYKHNATGITGSFKDLSLKTLYRYKKIEVKIPRRIVITTVSDQYTNSADFYFVGSEHRYFYYIDATKDGRYDRYSFTYPNSDEVVEIEDFVNYIKVYETDLTNADLIDVNPKSLPEVTLRDTLSSVYELEACYGKLDRTTDLFAPVELNQGGLYPADTLYPANDRYPQGNMIHPFPSAYTKLWTDTIGEQSFRYLIITYKTLENGQEVQKTLQRTVNTHGTTNYNMSSNWLFLNLFWNASDVGDFADAMVLKMKDIRWFPFEMWAAGLPHIETGDAIEITDKEGNTHTSYILQRQLNGIHNLQDTFINGELDVF